MTPRPADTVRQYVALRIILNCNTTAASSKGGCRAMAVSRSISLTAAALLLAAATAAHAAGDLSRQDPIEITVELGKPGSHAFVPNKLRFETGKLYKLSISTRDSVGIPVT